MDFISPPSDEPTPEAPPYLLLMALLLAVLFGSLLGGGIVMALGAARGADLPVLLEGLDENSPLGTRNFVRLANLISHFCTFTLSSVMIGVFFFRRRWIAWFRLDRQPPAPVVVLSLLFILAAFPVAQTTYWINQQLPIPEWARALESSASGMLKSLLTMKSPAELLLNLLVVAVLPAVGEELLFRGIVQQSLRRWTGRAHLAIWITGFLFSAIHLQFEGFLPRLLLGAALGYIFFWTRNLWAPIIAHFFFNGAQVAAQYILAGRGQPIDLEKVEDPQWGAFAAALLVLAAAGYALYRRRPGGEEPADPATQANSNTWKD